MKDEVGLDPCTATSDDGWLRAEASERDGDPCNAGKWMLFVPCDRAADCWRIVRKGTLSGKLGVAAKVSVEANRKGAPEHVICVYTQDWRDETDVLRVIQTLVQLGAAAMHKIPTLAYKPDALTYAGQSGSIYRIRPPYQVLEPGSSLYLRPG